MALSDISEEIVIKMLAFHTVALCIIYTLYIDITIFQHAKLYSTQMRHDVLMIKKVPAGFFAYNTQVNVRASISSPRLKARCRLLRLHFE